jgi:hypothetical protein
LHVIGVASASAGKRGREPLAQYSLLRFKPDRGHWHVELHRRGLAIEDGEIVEGRITLS